MNKESKFEKIMPALDRYMLAKLKMLQMIKKTGQVSVELANEVSNAQDFLTEEWVAINSEIFKITTNDNS